MQSRRPHRQHLIDNPVWDGQRFVSFEARRAWETSEVLVRQEDISKARSWRDVLGNHTVIVNLGGVTERFQAELDDGTRSLRPPTRGYMSVLPAGRAFAGTFQGGTVHYAIWEMPPGLLARVAEEAGMPRVAELTARLSHRDDQLYGSIRRLAELAASPDNLAELEGACIVRSLGLHLLSHYGAAKERLPPRRPGARLSRRAVADLQDFIDSHLSEKISLADLAAVAGHSAHNLLIGFRQHFALTPHRYVLEQRLKRALWQLLHTTKPIAEIAYGNGFASQSHMTSAFKSRFGVTPYAARRDLG